MKPKILNVGCGYSKIPIPDIEEVRLDIDPIVEPDIVCDARNLTEVGRGEYDGVWMQHVLEHFCEYDVQSVLNGIDFVLKPTGVLILIVPDIVEAISHVIEKQASINDVILCTQTDPIRTIDMIYGLQSKIASGNEFYAHKMAFDRKSLTGLLHQNGFKHIHFVKSVLEIRAVATKDLAYPEWIQKYMSQGTKHKEDEITEMWMNW
jgi:predicted SAM-dependent methyltransferase